MVVKFENNQFTRIDNSFEHKNQFFAVPFLHDKTIFLWSGYGLFTFKNILTYYDFSLNEWQQKNQVSVNSVEPRYIAFSVKKDNNLYIFGGDASSDSESITGRTVKDNYVWRLNLKNFSWHKEKKYKSNLNLIKDNFDKDQKFQLENKIIHISNNIKEVDIFENKVKTYTIKNYKNIRKIIYHKKSKRITYVYLTENNNYFINNENYDDFRGDLIEETNFYEDSTPLIIFKISIFLFISLGLFFLIRIILKKRKKNKAQILYSNKQNLFLIKKNTPIKFNKLNFLVLKLFLDKQPQFFSINSINEVLSIDTSQEYYLTINKRRERVLKDLTLEISSLLNIPKEAVFTTRSGELDKRMKEIKLNILIKIIN